MWKSVRKFILQNVNWGGFVPVMKASYVPELLRMPNFTASLNDRLHVFRNLIEILTSFETPFPCRSNHHLSNSRERVPTGFVVSVEGSAGEKANGPGHHSNQRCSKSQAPADVVLDIHEERRRQKPSEVDGLVVPIYKNLKIKKNLWHTNNLKI